MCHHMSHYLALNSHMLAAPKNGVGAIIRPVSHHCHCFLCVEVGRSQQQAACSAIVAERPADPTHGTHSSESGSEKESRFCTAAGPDAWRAPGPRTFSGRGFYSDPAGRRERASSHVRLCGGRQRMCGCSARRRRQPLYSFQAVSVRVCFPVTFGDVFLKTPER